jgi:hypothetical protein
MSDYIIKTLEYYFEDGSHVIFKKYTIDTLGIVRHKISGKTPSYGKGIYNKGGVWDDDGKRWYIYVGRAVASTFLGEPSSLKHTADHIKNEQKRNDALTNIRWLSKKGQSNNRNMPETLKTAFVILNKGIEKTIKEWVQYMNSIKKPTERDYTASMIKKYAQKKQHGFAYKEYPNLEGEVWLPIEESETKQGRWEISNMKRVKYVTRHASNILWDERLSRLNGYPSVGINGKHCLCHILSFKTFYPEMWAMKKPDEFVLHEDDDKEDFRPHKLRLGTKSDNAMDSYDNGIYDGTKTARMRCASYVDGVFEKEHESQTAAAEYLKSKGCSKASIDSIKVGVSMAIIGKRNTAYGRTWVKLYMITK